MYKTALIWAYRAYSVDNPKKSILCFFDRSSFGSIIFFHVEQNISRSQIRLRFYEEEIELVHRNKQIIRRFWQFQLGLIVQMISSFTDHLCWQQ